MRHLTAPPWSLAEAGLFCLSLPAQPSSGSRFRAGASDHVSLVIAPEAGGQTR